MYQEGLEITNPVAYVTHMMDSLSGFWLTFNLYKNIHATWEESGTMPNTNLTGITFETWPTSEIKPLTFQPFFVTCHSISFIRNDFWLESIESVK